MSPLVSRKSKSLKTVWFDAFFVKTFDFSVMVLPKMIVTDFFHASNYCLSSKGEKMDFMDRLQFYSEVNIMIYFPDQL